MTDQRTEQDGAGADTTATAAEAAGADRLRLRLELDRLRTELAQWHAREADLTRREQALASERESMRDSRLAALNLIEDAIDARNRAARAQAETLSERDLLHDVLESLPGVFYLFDANGRYLRWNREYELVSGYSGAEIAQMHPLQFFGDAADRSLIGERIARAFTEGRAFAEGGFTSKDGSVRPYYFTGQRIVIDGQPCLAGLGVDLSARRALEEQVREAQKMEAVGTLAGGVAHDFNNILGGMLGNLSLLGATLEVGHPGRTELESLHKSALRARRLVQQILAFSRREPTTLRVQALAPIVEETLAMLRATLPAGVELNWRGLPEAVYARLDATQIEQVLLNLCTNAWHALGGGAGRIDVTLDLADAPGWLCLRVADNGCGMDEATRARIFEPFYTTKSVGSGTGLGLAVVHGIVVAHAGSISVDSAPGRGSCFTTLLPTAAPDAATEAQGEGAAPGLPPGGRRLLYIDDDETMTLVVGRLLERAGVQATCMQDAERAIELLRADPFAFDLVVTDFNMPAVSGLEVAHTVRGLRPTLPVVISSGHIDDTLRRRADELGVVALLHKERTAEDLLPLVARVLAQRSTGHNRSH